MGIVNVLKKRWKPPSSKDSGITDADTLFTNKTIEHVDKYYNREVRFINVKEDGSDINSTADHRYTELGPGKVALPIDLSQHLYQDGKNRFKDPKYNDENAPLQIHCFGDSWTYGWDVKQEETFVHLLGNKNTSVYNYGGGKTGFLRRLAWNRPSPTVPTHPAMPATDLCHPVKNRPLSVQEYKRIQQLPDNFELSGNLLQQYKQLGNAVPVGLGEAVGRTLIDHLNGSNWSEEEIPDFKFSRYKNTTELNWKKN